MKKLTKTALWFSALIIVFNLSMNIYSETTGKKINNEKGILAPIPEFLVNTFYKESRDFSFWEIEGKVLATRSAKPEISALSAISYDLTSDTLLYSTKRDTKFPIASLTKIMTAVVAIENMDLDQEIKISRNASEIGENVMGISKGEVYALEELLYGLMLNSGNDAAEAIAEASPFGRENFVHLMNKKAEDLGLTNTRFTNPSGLEGDGEQYSTAGELVVLSRYALENKDFAKIVSTYSYHISYSDEHKELYLYNQTNLLTSYPGVKGLKTGFTPEAGMSLVTYLEYGGHRIIAVLLSSDNRRQEMKDLLDYSLESLGVDPPPHR